MIWRNACIDVIENSTCCMHNLGLSELELRDCMWSCYKKILLFDEMYAVLMKEKYYMPSLRELVLWLFRALSINLQCLKSLL